MSENREALPRLSSGAELIGAERERQMDTEGWTPEHDDGHEQGELAGAAACYAIPPHVRKKDHISPSWRALWPWESRWWKPTPDDRVRELVKAGALIAAEIDRLQRAEVGPDA